MTATRLLDDIASGVFNTNLPDEPAFKAAWQAIPATDPFAATLHGGLLVDRLSWVFLVAYQGAVRACFPGLLPGKLVSFATSEDKSGEYPGTSLDEKGRLQGHKSWLAANRIVDELIVTVDSIEHMVLVDARAPGVSISHRDAPAFLADMSQGMVAFEDVVAAREVTEHSAADFGLAEPFFVSVAACGYLLKECLRLNLDRANEIVGALSRLEAMYQQGFASDVEALLSCYEALKACGQACTEMPDMEKGDDWQANGRLLGIYGKGLRTRVEQTK